MPPTGCQRAALGCWTKADSDEPWRETQVSLAEVMPYESAAEYAGPDRTPPQDVAAEQSVLGAMLLSKDAIADVVEIDQGPRLLPSGARDDLRRDRRPVRPRRAGRRDHGGRRAGKRGRAGPGRRRTSTCTTCCRRCPIAANAGYYAEIVREKAILRRLVEASTRIAQLGYAGQGDVDRHRRCRPAGESTRSTEGKASEDYEPLSALMEATLDEIEALECARRDRRACPPASPTSTS